MTVGRDGKFAFVSSNMYILKDRPARLKRGSLHATVHGRRRRLCLLIARAATLKGVFDEVDNYCLGGPVYTCRVGDEARGRGRRRRDFVHSSVVTLIISQVGGWPRLISRSLVAQSSESNGKVIYRSDGKGTGTYAIRYVRSIDEIVSAFLDHRRFRSVPVSDRFSPRSKECTIRQSGSIDFSCIHH